MSNIPVVVGRGAVFLMLGIASFGGCSSEPDQPEPASKTSQSLTAHTPTANPPDDNVTITTKAPTATNMVEPSRSKGLVVAPAPRRATASERKAIEATIAAQRARGPVGD